MARLGRSLAKLRIANPHSREQWLERCRKLIAALAERGGATDQLVYIQVTRGVALRDHVMPAGIEPTVFMMASAMKPASGEQRHHGVAVHQRARLPLGARRHQEHLAARQRAGAADVGRPRRGRDDHVPRRLPDRGGRRRTSGSCTKALLGPPKSEHVLEGIRYDLIKELCEECGIAYNLRPIAEADVTSADELLLSSATKEILPVTTLDGEAVGHGALRGKPGPVYARLYEAYQRAKLTQAIFERRRRPI